MHFKSAHGPFSLVLIGAMLVASVETPFAGLITPPGQTVTDWKYHCGAHHKFAQGDEVGRFQYGSTVITLIPNSMAGFHAAMTSGRAVRMGESLGQP